MFIYWSFILLSVPFFKLKYNYKSYFLFLAVIVSLVSAFQSDNVSIDRQAYFGFFENYTNYESDRQSFIMEPVFHYIFLVFNKTLLTQVFAFFIVCFTGVILKFYLINKYSAHVGLSMLVFFSYLFLLQDMNQIRIGLAIGFFYLAVVSYFRGLIKRWFFFSVVAISCHYSSFIVLLCPLYIFRTLSRNSLLFFVFFGGLVLMFWSYAGLGVKIMHNLASIDPTGKLDWYLSNSSSRVANPFRRLLPHFIFLIPVIVKYDLLIKKKPYMILFVQMYVLYIMSFLFFYPFPTLAYRVSDLFLFSSVFVLPGMLLVVKEKLVVTLVILFFSLFQFIYVVHILNVFGEYSTIGLI